MRTLNIKNGFTLVELLVVISIIAVVGSIISSIVISSFRETNKTNAISLLRQNGNHAMTLMARMIREAKSFDGVSPDGTSYTTNCTSGAGATTPTPLPQQYHFIKISAFDNGQTTFICPYSALSGATIASESAASSSVFLFDPSSARIDSCFFTCSQATVLDFPTIGIQMKLSQANSSPLFENKASVSLQTSVVLRNR